MDVLPCEHVGILLVFTTFTHIYPRIVDRDMFMRYRGGGIGHRYMREVEDRFEDMRREQDYTEEVPQASHPPQASGSHTGEPPTGMFSKAAPIGNRPAADGETDLTEEVTPSDEEASVSYEDDYFGMSGEDDYDYDEITQGTYGLGEY